MFPMIPVPEAYNFKRLKEIRGTHRGTRGRCGMKLDGSWFGDSLGRLSFRRSFSWLLARIGWRTMKTHQVLGYWWPKKFLGVNYANLSKDT